mgnify:CR=1 FL=1
MKPPAAAIRALLDGTSDDPFALLGPHEGPAGLFVRAWIPGADTVTAHGLLLM